MGALPWPEETAISEYKFVVVDTHTHAHTAISCLPACFPVSSLRTPFPLPLHTLKHTPTHNSCSYLIPQRRVSSSGKLSQTPPPRCLPRSARGGASNSLFTRLPTSPRQTAALREQEPGRRRQDGAQARHRHGEPRPGVAARSGGVHPQAPAGPSIARPGARLQDAPARAPNLQVGARRPRGPPPRRVGGRRRAQRAGLRAPLSRAPAPAARHLGSWPTEALRVTALGAERGPGAAGAGGGRRRRERAALATTSAPQERPLGAPEAPSRGGARPRVPAPHAPTAPRLPTWLALWNCFFSPATDIATAPGRGWRWSPGSAGPRGRDALGERALGPVPARLGSAGPASHGQGHGHRGCHPRTHARTQMATRRPTAPAQPIGRAAAVCK